MGSRILLLLSFCGLGAFAALKSPSPAPLSDVAMGLYELKGGGTQKTLSSAPFPPSGQNTGASGTFRNDLPTPLTDLTIYLRQNPLGTSYPTTTGGAANGTSGTSSNTQPGSAAPGSTIQFNFDPPIPSMQTSNFNVTGLLPNGAASMIMELTPSVASPNGEANTVTAFRYTPTSDGARHGLDSLWHSRILAEIYNDNTLDVPINQLAGTIQLPQGGSLSLSAVHLYDPSSSMTAVTGTSVSINGLSFQVTGFTPLDSGMRYTIVFVLSSSLPGKRVQVEMDATFSM